MPLKKNKAHALRNTVAAGARRGPQGAQHVILVHGIYDRLISVPTCLSLVRALSQSGCYPECECLTLSGVSGKDQ